MQITIKLGRLFFKQGESAKRGALLRLLAGVTSTGKPFKPKKRADGATFGGTGVASEVLQATVIVNPNGFTIVFGEKTGLFVRGVKVQKRTKKGKIRNKVRQPGRPFIRFTRDERERWEREAAEETARQITAQLDATA